MDCQFKFKKSLNSEMPNKDNANSIVKSSEGNAMYRNIGIV